MHALKGIDPVYIHDCVVLASEWEGEQDGLNVAEGMTTKMLLHKLSS